MHLFYCKISTYSKISQLLIILTDTETELMSDSEYSCTESVHILLCHHCTRIYLRINRIVISRDPSFLHWRYRLTTVPMKHLTDQGCQTYPYLHTETFVIFERLICKFFFIFENIKI